MPRTAFIALLGFLATAYAAPEPTEIELDDPHAAFIHPMGFVFPSEVNGMSRTGVTRYDDDGKNVSAGYNHSSPKIIATVYVYPGLAPNSELESHFQQTAEYLAEATGMKLLKIEKAAIALGEKKREGYRALFSIGEPHRLAIKGESLSEFYLFPLRENWHLKFRITYAAQDREQAAPVIEKFLNGFAWPDKKGSSTKWVKTLIKKLLSP